MRRNKLYTVSKYNKPMFMYPANVDRENHNIYDGFTESLLNFGPAQISNLPKAGAGGNIGTGSVGGFLSGIGDKLGGVMGGGKLAGSPMGGLISAGAGLVGGLANSAISGGLKSGAGSAISGIGSTVGGAVGAVNPVLGAAITVGSNIIGGGVNALWGESVDEEALKEANEGTNTLRNFSSNAGSFDEVKGPEAVANVKDVYKGGVFNDVSDKNEELERQRREAQMFADRSITNNVSNLATDQLNNALANYSAYGGHLDFGGGALGLMQQNEYFNTIDRRTDAIAGKNNTAYTGGAKTFADGGLKAAFLDSFGSDPIGAAVRYNQGLEALAAQEEAKQIEAQKAAEYADMQKRLLSLETENQGLQAMMAAMPSTNPLPEIPEASSSTPSPATPRRSSGNKNWDYIEGQLRKSGKFNDIQIEGIKYNLQRESAINPDAVGDNGSAFGLAQWHGSRKPKDMSIEGQTRHLIETLSNYDGKDHWIGKDNYEGFMSARTPEEAHYYITRGYERPAAYILNKVKRDSDMSLKRMKAFGGELGTNGTDFTNGLLYIDEGGSHESNPLDGVPMGLDPEGIPNLVEEGETVYDDYVFSDRMMVPDFMLKDLGLPKSKKGISFADASKKLAQESEKRPNDPISQDGLQASLSRLAEIQETERMRKQAKEYQGLESYACGGKIGNKYDGRNPFGQRMQLGYKMPVLPDYTALAMAGALPKVSTDSSSYHEYGKNIDSASDSFIDKIKFDPEKAEKELEEVMGKREATPAITDAIRQGAAMQGYNPDMSLSDVLPQYTQQHREDEYDPYPTWMRYAPVWGLGAMTLTDALGLTNNPDYSAAARLEAAANAAGYAPKVSYKPIGNYLTYRPMDIWFEQNRLNANSRATDRAILNSGANQGSKMAGLLASGYNDQIASGELYRKALEYNDAKRERVADFNRRTNMFNSQMGLEAAMANARYHQAAQQMGLSGLAQAAALRDSIDARTSAARSANLSNFLTSLGNIGRENFALNQINSDRSRQYGVYRNGVSEHKRSSKGKKDSRWT